MNDDFDALDRALFALPLEEPPHGLREAILRATCCAPLAAFALDGFDIALIGSALAVAVWLTLVLITSPSLASTVNVELLALTRAFAGGQTLVWLAAGGAVAAWFSFGHLFAGSGRFERS